MFGATIDVEKNESGYEIMKQALVKTFSNDMDVFNNMNIYTPVWATLVNSKGEVNNGFAATNIDEWVEELKNKLDDVQFIVFMDHVKKDLAKSKIELHVNFK